MSLTLEELTCKRIASCLDMVLSGDRMGAIIKLNTETSISVKAATEILNAVCRARDDALSESTTITRWRCVDLLQATGKMSVDWRLISEARQKNSRYDLPTKASYREIANKLATKGNSKLAALALNAARCVNQL